MKEIWKQIPGCKKYEVSTHGRIKSSRGILKPYIDKRGYCSVSIRRHGIRKNRTIHRIVLEVFIGECPEGMTASHLDGDPTNNRIENLSWETHSDNCRRKKHHGTWQCGERIGNSKLTAAEVYEIRESYPNMTQTALAKKYGVNHRSIGFIISRRNWKHI
jgi:hypothetical protein